MTLKMKNRSINMTQKDLGLDINIINIKCLSTMMVMCTKQHLSNI